MMRKPPLILVVALVFLVHSIGLVYYAHVRSGRQIGKSGYSEG